MQGMRWLSRNVGWYKNVLMVDANINAKNAVALKYALMIDRNLHARTAVVLLYVNIIDTNLHARTAEVPKFVNIIDVNIDAKSVETLLNILLCFGYGTQEERTRSMVGLIQIISLTQIFLEGL